MIELPIKSQQERVLIVDDHPAIREALALYIAKSPRLVICGEAADEASALRAFEEHTPTMVIVDISLKSGDGIDLIKRIRAKDEVVRILVCSMHSEKLYAERAIRAGANGFISKEHAMDKIMEAIECVLDGNVYLSPVMTQHLLNRLSATGPNAVTKTSIELLSDRELEVLRLIGMGTRTTEIARQLSLSVKTVETYRDRIRKKLGLNDGVDLVRFASQWVLEDLNNQ